MAKVLVIIAHPVTEMVSRSVTVAEAFTEEYKKVNPDDVVEEINLFTIGVPPVNGETMDAWTELKSGRDLKDLSPEHQKLVAKHDQLLNQFIGFDKYVFVNPMYNLFFPAELKAYIDVLCVAKKTFMYTPEGPKGLLEGRKVMHIQSAGGFYHTNGQTGEMDYGHKYLTGIMNFLGINDIKGIFIEGADYFPDKEQEIVAAAVEEAKQEARTF